MNNWKKEKHKNLIMLLVSNKITENEYLKKREVLGKNYKWTEMKEIVRYSHIWNLFILKLHRQDRLKAFIEIQGLDRAELRNIMNRGGRIDDYFKLSDPNERGISNILFELAIVMDVPVEYLLFDKDENKYLTPHQNTFFEYKRKAEVCNIDSLCEKVLEKPTKRIIQGFRIENKDIPFLNVREHEIYARLDRRLDYFYLQFYLNSFTDIN